MTINDKMSESNEKLIDDVIYKIIQAYKCSFIHTVNFIDSVKRSNLYDAIKNYKLVKSNEDTKENLSAAFNSCFNQHLTDKDHNVISNFDLFGPQAGFVSLRTEAVKSTEVQEILCYNQAINSETDVIEKIGVCFSKYTNDNVANLGENTTPLAVENLI